jgi:hypothetical protein
MSQESLSHTTNQAVSGNGICRILWPFMGGVCFAGLSALLGLRRLQNVPRIFWITTGSVIIASLGLSVLFLVLEKRQSAESNYWFIQLWTDNRKLFQELIKHSLGFGLFIGLIAVLHYYSEHAGLPDQQKSTLGTVHFYFSIVWLVIFSVSFIIKWIILEYRGMRQ